MVLEECGLFGKVEIVESIESIENGESEESEEEESILVDVELLLGRKVALNKE